MGRNRVSNRQSPRTEQEKLDEILTLIHSFRWTLGYFLVLLFGNFEASKAQKESDKRRTESHAAFVKNFLSSSSTNDSTSLYNILSLIYEHPDGTPTRNTSASNQAIMARPQMLDWAFSIVQDQVHKEATNLASRTTGIHLPADRQDWDTIMQFSLDTLRECIFITAPLLYSLVLGAATPRNRTTLHIADSDDVGSVKSREPEVVAVVAILMMVISRNMQANMFQKIIGVWLFACSAPAHVYRVLCRFGLSVGYTSVIQILQKLSEQSMKTTRYLAEKKSFLVIIDNINRQRRFWQPTLGQHNLMMSGTAATFVELVNCASGAFDPKPVLDAKEKQLRLSLTTEVLYNRIDQDHLSSVMALHCLNFLVSNCPSLSHLSNYVQHELRTTYALHRMPDNTSTRAHPLATSNINEGSAAGCRDALNDILLRQLKLPPTVVDSILIIIGGDLGTIEKIRALQTLESSCPHGYPTFSWVLPLVQLWHMGWADLARIINTHWGKVSSSDPSSLWYNCGLLGRKVKPEVRPEYYPALALILDTLEADVLDCWRLLLDTSDLDHYFSSLTQPPPGSNLLEKAERLVSLWACTHAHDRAAHSDKYWDGPIASISSTDPPDSDSDVPLAHKVKSQHTQNIPPQNKPALRSRKKRKTCLSTAQLEGFQGDHCLANSILRLRDSLWHYEFNWAVADGDIGRAMQVMAVWQFTFAGSGASKYSTELLELACGFLYEFPPALQNALLNNWLCNFSGLPGCWFAMDLMQEHHIRELKDKSQRSDEDFDSNFFQNVVSRNVRWFTQVRSTVNKAANLQDRSATHSSTKRHGTANRLRTALEREHVHHFVRGRSYGWVVQDDFTAGFNVLPAKLTRFLRQTISDRPGTGLDAPNDSQTAQEEQADLEQVEGEEAEALGEAEDSSMLPTPSMVVDGQLVTGDVADDLLDEDPSFDVV